MESEYLVENNIGLVGYVIGKYAGNSLTKSNALIDREDLFQIGSIGLLKAARTWKEDSGHAFSTYAVTCIRNELADEFRKQKRSGEFDYCRCELDDAFGIAGGDVPEKNLLAESVIDQALTVFSDEKCQDVRNLLSVISLGYGISEAARMVGLREGQARSVIRRIKHAAN